MLCWYTGGVEAQPYSFLNLALDEGGWSSPRPRHSAPGRETGDTLRMGLGGRQVRFGQMSLAPTGVHTLNPLPSRYTKQINK
jgi:hypothetical protein